MPRSLAAAVAVSCVLGSAASLGAQDHPMPMAPGAPAMMTTPLGIPMLRMGSGTTWIPDASPIPTGMARAGSWELTYHGFVFVQYDHQAGPRGDDQLGSLNWGMLMASHPLAGGMLQLRTMLSLDPATVTGRGYPLLLQSGESYQGEPLHDRQHPHDFWMELGALYLRAVAPNLGVEMYVAPSGEPALGPVAFMHRPSATDDPAAPIGHHWQDATHVTFGVLTAGVFGRRWKLEGSWFNGREPDEHRWDFDLRRPDSWSGRLTLNPTPHWSATLGYGYLKSPEADEPDQSKRRLVASLLYGRPLGSSGELATALVYGINEVPGAPATHSALAEVQANLGGRHTLSGRFELVQKTAADLALDDTGPLLTDGRRFQVASGSLGYLREVGRTHGITAGVGIRGTINFVPAELAPVYGSAHPVGAMLFVRLRLASTSPGPIRMH
jgi:hypothetical protein